MLSKISELQERQIINIADGKCLGGVKDIEIDLDEGCIKAIILPGNNNFWGLLQSRDEMTIPWEKVVRIGIDVVLVDMAVEDEGKGRKLSKLQAARQSEKWQDELQAYQQEVAGDFSEGSGNRSLTNNH